MAGPTQAVQSPGRPRIRFQRGGDDAARDPPPAGVDRGDPLRPGDQDRDAVRGHHREGEAGLFAEQGVPLAAEAGPGRQRQGGMGLLRPGHGWGVRLDRPQDLLALVGGSPAGEAHLNVTEPVLPDRISAFVERSPGNHRAFRRAARMGSISSAMASAMRRCPSALGWISSLFREGLRRILPTMSSTTGTSYSSPSRS